MSYICNKCGADFSMGDWYGKNVEVKVGRSGPSIGFNLHGQHPWSAESGREYFAEQTVAICDYCNKSFFERMRTPKPTRAEYDAKIKAEEDAFENNNKKIEDAEVAEIEAEFHKTVREAEQKAEAQAQWEEAQAQEMEKRQNASRSIMIKIMNSATLNPIYTPEHGFDIFLDLVDEFGFVPRESEYFLPVAKQVIESRAWSTARLQAKITNDDRILSRCFKDFMELGHDTERGLFFGSTLWQPEPERITPPAAQKVSVISSPPALSNASPALPPAVPDSRPELPELPNRSKSQRLYRDAVHIATKYDRIKSGSVRFVMGITDKQMEELFAKMERDGFVSPPINSKGDRKSLVQPPRKK